MGEDSSSNQEQGDPIYYNAKPNILAVATCSYDKIEISIGENNILVPKDFSSLMIVISDMVIIFFFVMFIFILDVKKEKFQNLYKDYMI